MVQEPGSLDALIPLTGTQATDALLAGVGSAVSHVLLMLIAAGAISLLVNADLCQTEIDFYCSINYCHIYIMINFSFQASLQA